MRIKFVSDLFSTSGLSTHARFIVEALLNHMPADTYLYLEDAKKEPSEAEIDKQLMYKMVDHMVDDGDPYDVSIYFEPAQFIKTENLDPKSLNIAFTQWETDRIRNYDYEGNPRNNWVKQLNKMDAVFTTSALSVMAYNRSGVICPCFNIPGPIMDKDSTQSNEELPIACINYDTLSKTMIPRVDRKLVIGYFAQAVPRKNIEAFIKTIACGLSGRKDVVALLKTYGSATFSGDEELKSYLAKFKKSLQAVDSPDIVVITNKLTDKEMSILYNSVDVYYAPSRAEGYNVPAAVAASRGIPTISTNYGGATHFLKKEYLIPYASKYVHGMKDYDSNQVWAEIDEVKAADVIKATLSQIKSMNELLISEEEIPIFVFAKKEIATFAKSEAGEKVFIEKLFENIGLLKANR